MWRRAQVLTRNGVELRHRDRQVNRMVSDVSDLYHPVRTQHLLNTERPALGVGVMRSRGEKVYALSEERPQAIRRSNGLTDAIREGIRQRCRGRQQRTGH